MVPGYVPVALLLALEAVAVVAMLAFSPSRLEGSKLVLCARCAQLHDRAEVFGRGADAAAVGALAFLIVLPFVAAQYESGFTFSGALLAVSVMIAVLAVAAEIDFLARSAAARIWPRLSWSAEPARIIGGGARWLGIILAVYVFSASYNGAGREAPGVGALFGGVGQRLVVDLASTWTIWVAVTILALAQIVALLSRWLVPLVLGSLPTSLARRRDPHRSSA